MFETLFQELPAFAPSEEAFFRDSVQRLFKDGFLWRDDEDDRRYYSFAVKHLGSLQDFFNVTGMRLTHHERVNILHLSSDGGTHRRRLDKETTIWLLLVRLIQAEQNESSVLQLTRHPTVSVGTIYLRYCEFFPGRSVRKKSIMEAALKTMHGLKIIRAPDGGLFRPMDPESLVEMLPVLQVILPNSNLVALVGQLKSLSEPGAPRVGAVARVNHNYPAGVE